jgi:hypothetical protein
VCIYLVNFKLAVLKKSKFSSRCIKALYYMTYTKIYLLWQVLSLLIFCNLYSVFTETIYSINGISTERKERSQPRKYRQEKIDGLANADVSVVITSTENFGKIYLRSRVIPSSRTWMRYFTNVFVVIDDTTDIRFVLS